MADKDVTTKLIIQCDAGGMVAATDKASSGLDGIVGATQKAETQFLNFATAAVAAAVAMAAFKAAEYIKDATMLAARVETLGVVMKVVGNNAGYTGAQMEQYANGVAGMGITTESSRQAVVKMASSHMDLAHASGLARIAQDAAVIGNINSSEAFDAMIHGITSGQIEVLRTIGINVQFEESYKRLAQELGKSKEELTEREKIQARTNIVLEKGIDISGAYAASMDTAGKLINSMKRPAEETALSLGQLFTPSLNLLARQFYDHASDTAKLLKDSKPTIEEWGNNILKVTITIESEFMRLAMLVDKLGGTMTSIAAKSYTVAGVVTRAMTIGQFGQGMEDRSAGMKAANDMYAARYSATESELVKLAEKYNQIGTAPKKVADNLREAADREALKKEKKEKKDYTEHSPGFMGWRSEQEMQKEESEYIKQQIKIAAQATKDWEDWNSDDNKNQAEMAAQATKDWMDWNTDDNKIRAEWAKQNSFDAAADQQLTRNFLSAQASMPGADPALKKALLDQEQQDLEYSYAMNANTFEEYERRKFAVSAMYADKRKQLEQNTTISNIQQYGMYASNVSNLANNLSQLAGKKNKEMFYIAKGVSIASTTINTAEAVMKAYAQTGIFGGPIAAAIVGAVGASQIALIAAQQPDGGSSASGSTGGGFTMPGQSPVTQPVSQTANGSFNVTFAPVFHGPQDAQALTRWTEDYFIPTMRDLKTRGVTV